MIPAKHLDVTIQGGGLGVHFAGALHRHKTALGGLSGENRDDRFTVFASNNFC